MPAHLTTKEQVLLDQLVRTHQPASHARARINRLRTARGTPPISLCTVRRFFRGATHRRGRKERRGRPSLLGRKDVKSLEKARLRLLKEAGKVGKNKHRVTHEDVRKEAGLQDRSSTDWACNCFMHHRRSASTSASGVASTFPGGPSA